mgnify:FL=1
MNYKPFTVPARILVCGPSSSGKTTFVLKLLQKASDLFVFPCGENASSSRYPFDNIFLVHRSWQGAYSEIARSVPIPVYFVRNESGNEVSQVSEREGYSVEELIQEKKSRRPLFIFDDALQLQGDEILDLFCRQSHHLNASIIFILQNIFERSNKILRTLSLNCTAIVLMKNPRDASQIRHLAYQMYPTTAKAQKMIDIYHEATAAPHSYLVIDLRQDTSDACRLRSNLFCEKTPCYPIVYSLFP